VTTNSANRFLKHLGFEEKEFVTTSKSIPAYWVMVRPPKKYSISKSDSNDTLSNSSFGSFRNLTVTSGPTLIKNVKLGDKLGAGHSSQVFSGIWLETTKVACKKSLSIDHEEELLRYFLSNSLFSSIPSSLNHPNIVKYLGIFCDSEADLYLVTEFITGGNLKDMVRSKKDKLGPKDLLNMAQQTAAALRYLEEMKVVHNDLALRNLLVAPGGSEEYTVKIADFGLRFEKCYFSNVFQCKYARRKRFD
jgi:hypothetical protein